ncbi:MAG: YicC family protein, partial [Firmicutes bacterium]|nr:YicC family protein [Bacillota bacterium]
MIKSMTGFGRGEYRDENRSVLAEIRSVNHRYCDINVRIPKKYSFAEEAVKKTVKEYFRRGKADVSIIIEQLADADVEYQLNTALAAKYMEKIGELADAFQMN